MVSNTVPALCSLQAGTSEWFGHNQFLLVFVIVTQHPVCHHYLKISQTICTASFDARFELNSQYAKEAPFCDLFSFIPNSQVTSEWMPKKRELVFSLQGFSMCKIMLAVQFSAVYNKIHVYRHTLSSHHITPERPTAVYIPSVTFFVWPTVFISWAVSIFI